MKHGPAVEQKFCRRCKRPAKVDASGRCKACRVQNPPTSNQSFPATGSPSQGRRHDQADAADLAAPVNENRDGMGPDPNKRRARCDPGSTCHEREGGRDHDQSQKYPI